MTPPVFAAANVPEVQAVLKAGNGPLRFYAWGLAPQNAVYPYAVWRLSYGTPENYLGDRADVDSTTLQIDVYAGASDPQGAATSRNVRDILRNALESQCYVTSFLEEERDPDTQSYHSGFQTDWITDR